MVVDAEGSARSKKRIASRLILGLIGFISLFVGLL
jgi:hypothetical protein